jgi:hypothetical protein
MPAATRDRKWIAKCRQFHRSLQLDRRNAAPGTAKFPSWEESGSLAGSGIDATLLGEELPKARRRAHPLPVIRRTRCTTNPLEFHLQPASELSLLAAPALPIPAIRVCHWSACSLCRTLPDSPPARNFLGTTHAGWTDARMLALNPWRNINCYQRPRGCSPCFACA